MAERPEADRARPKKALLISMSRYSGFHVGRGRLSLGWMTVSSVPSAVEDRLNAALEENQGLRAELARLSDEHARQLARAAQENERLKAELERVVNDDGRERERLHQENQDLHQSRRRATEQEEKLSQALAEIERLKAFMDRASSGMR